jgi:hypothetical protein
MLSVLADAPRDPAELAPGLSPELMTLVMRCIERDPERRFASCDELATALLACPGVAAAAEESSLSALLAGRYPAERAAADELMKRAAQARSPGPRGDSAGWGRRPLIAILVLAVAFAIIAWAVTSRGASTC